MGATLSLAYAERHPNVILGLILRGSFLAVNKISIGSAKEVQAGFFPSIGRVSWLRFLKNWTQKPRVKVIARPSMS